MEYSCFRRHFRVRYFGFVLVLGKLIYLRVISLTELTRQIVKYKLPTITDKIIRHR